MHIPRTTLLCHVPMALFVNNIRVQQSFSVYTEVTQYTNLCCEVCFGFVADLPTYNSLVQSKTHWLVPLYNTIRMCTSYSTQARMHACTRTQHTYMHTHNL